MPNNIEVINEARPIIQVIFPENRIVEVSHAGPTGPAGAAGPTGTDPGYEYHQTTPAASWGPYTVPVGLGRRPTVAIYVDNELVDAPVVIEGGQVTIQFPYPVSGYTVLA